MKENTEILYMEQGTEEWHKARAGYVTASIVRAACDTYKSGANKGKLKAEADQLAFRLACERLTGEIMDVGDFNNAYAARGIELEDEARQAYSLRAGFKIVKEVGIIRSTNSWRAASPDGLVINDKEGEGGLEVKCFLNPQKMRALVLENDPAAAGVDEQLQWALGLTGFAFWDLAFYCPQLKSLGLDLMVHRVYPDPEKVAAIEEGVERFEARVAEYTDALKSLSRDKVGLEW